MAIAHVQTKTNYTGGGTETSAAVTLDAAPTQGNLLVAGVTVQNDKTASIAASGSWNQAVTPIADGAPQTLAVFWRVAGAGEAAAQTICTWTGANNRSCFVSEWSPDTGFIWDSGSLEAATINADADATKTTTGTADPTDSVTRLLVGVGFSDGNRTFSTQKFNGSTTSVTERGDIAGGTTTQGETICVFDKVETTSSGNYTSESVASASDDGGEAILIFKQTASGGGGTVVQDIIGVGLIPFAR